MIIVSDTVPLRYLIYIDEVSISEERYLIITVYEVTERKR